MVLDLYSIYLLSVSVHRPEVQYWDGPSRLPARAAGTTWDPG